MNETCFYINFTLSLGSVNIVGVPLAEKYFKQKLVLVSKEEFTDLRKTFRNIIFFVKERSPLVFLIVFLYYTVKRIQRCNNTYRFDYPIL